LEKLARVSDWVVAAMQVTSGKAHGIGRIRGVVVAGGHYDGHILADRVGHGIPQRGRGEVATDAHVDHVGAVIDGPRDTGSDGRVAAVPAGTARFDRHELDVPTDPGDPNVVVGGRRGDPGDVSAVPVVIPRVAVTVHEVVAGKALARQVCVVAVHAGVNDGRNDALTQIVVPRLLAVDLGMVPLL